VILIAGLEGFADGFDEAGGGTEDDADDVDPVLMEPFVQEHAASPAYDESGGQDEGDLHKLFGFDESVDSGGGFAWPGVWGGSGH
jgi:hypothetical protein